VLFMIAMVFAVPAGLGFLVWQSFRSEARRAAAGRKFEPAGKRRWQDQPPGS
jgi:hypothetical protein